MQQEPRGELPSAHLIPKVALVLVNSDRRQLLDELRVGHASSGHLAPENALRPLFPPQVAESEEEAKAMIAAALARIVSGPFLVQVDDSDQMAVAS